MTLSSHQRMQLISFLYIGAGIILIIASGLAVPLFLLGVGVYCIYEGLRRRGRSLMHLFHRFIFMQNR
jgi:hypothetical protein